MADRDKTDEEIEAARRAEALAEDPLTVDAGELSELTADNLRRLIDAADERRPSVERMLANARRPRHLH
ncbi:MAG: hypothetical protein AAFX09_11530 [Pseudomonadota bacterium]